LQWLCEEVSKHLAGWTVLYLYFASSSTIGDKEVLYIDVLGPCAAQSPVIIFKEHGALVVLVDYRVIHSVSLCLEKIAHPQDL
jgi:hypothetical protein